MNLRVVTEEEFVKEGFFTNPIIDTESGREVVGLKQYRTGSETRYTYESNQDNYKVSFPCLEGLQEFLSNGLVYDNVPRYWRFT